MTHTSPAGAARSAAQVSNVRASATERDQVRAVVQSDYGHADTWKVDTVERPEIGSTEVLVDVRAAAIDRGTWHLMTGTPYLTRLAFGLGRPRQPVPGLDLAGVVVEVGSAVTQFAPGDEVFGIGRGSLATVAAALEKKLARKPAELTFAQAAAMGVSGLTALQGLLDVGRLDRGQRVLITGASGGVGTFAVQIAAAHGAEVTGACSTAKMDLVASLGAHRVIDHTRDDITAIDEPFDLVFDAVGTIPLRRLRRLLTHRGTIVIVGNADGGRWLGGLDRQMRGLVWSPFVSQRIKPFVARERGSDLERLSSLAAHGRLVPSVERCYSLDDAPEAMRHLEAGLARGKLVVLPTTNEGAEL